MTPPSEHNSSATASAPFIRRLTVGVLLINLFVGAIIGISLHQSRLQQREKAEITTRNLSQVLEQSIAGDIHKIDVVLLAVADEAERQMAENGDIDGSALNRFLTRQLARLPEVDSLRVADMQGVVRYGPGVTPGSQINVADREYFSRQRDDPTAGLVMHAKPVFARISKKWAIPASRRLNRPDGTFAGVVFVNISLDHLTRKLASIDIGEHGIATLFNEALDVTARHPDPQGIGSAIGMKLTSAQLKSLFQEGQSAGTYDAHSSLDGIERTFSYRRVSTLPFFIIVGLAMDDYLADWREEAAMGSALAALFFLTMLMSAWLIHRARMRQVEQEFMLIHQSRLAAMGEMIHNIAHQWRHPLFVLDLLTRNIRLMSSTGPLDARALEQDAEDMALQIREMSSTIDDFRNFFKLNRARQDFGLQEAIGHTLTLVGRTFDSHCIAIRVENGDEIVVNGYLNELTQVLLNVMNNAKDAVLEKELDHGELAISIGHDEENGWITIRDNAGGIPGEILPKIFSPYFSSKKNGAGIGLYMSRMIMDNMGGRISAKNSDGGAEFTIFLPLSRQAPGKDASSNLALDN